MIGATRDDAVGEAFDKVARMLGLPYPGGPHISMLAQKSRINADKKQIYADRKYKLPRPMINSKDFDFSFSGLKTAVLYLIRDLTKNHSDILQNVRMKQMIAREFEDAVTEVLMHKTFGALKKHNTKTLILGGGVSANEKIRKEFTREIKNNYPKVNLYLPERALTTDNALMIGVTAYFKKTPKTKLPPLIKADGNLRF